MRISELTAKKTWCEPGRKKSLVSQVFVFVGGVQHLQHFRHLLAIFSLLVTFIARVKTSHSKTLARRSFFFLCHLKRAWGRRKGRKHWIPSSRFHAKETGLGASVVISSSNQVSISIIWGAKIVLYVVPNTWKKQNVMSRHEGDGRIFFWDTSIIWVINLIIIYHTSE